MKASEIDMIFFTTKQEYLVWRKLVEISPDAILPEDLYAYITQNSLGLRKSQVTCIANAISRLRNKAVRDCLRGKRNEGYYFVDRDLTEDEIERFSIHIQ